MGPSIVHMYIFGDREPSQYSPRESTIINGKPITLKLDLGGNIWLVGVIEGETLTMVKTRFTGDEEVTFIEKRRRRNYEEACVTQQTFTEACFKGEVHEEDPSRPDEKQPIKFEIAADRQPSQYSPRDDTTINGRTVALKLDLGGNIWIVGAIDGETLTMIKTRFTGDMKATYLKK